MEARPTIAFTRTCHNRRAWAIYAPAVLCGALLGGCAPPRMAPPHQPRWHLAVSAPSVPVSLIRLRTPPDQILPDLVCRELCPEFKLVLVKRQGDWELLRRFLGLPDGAGSVDFACGMVVGVLANVGERAEPGWPLHITTVQPGRTGGRIDVVFAPGIYYPLDTAGYLELAYVSNLHEVEQISINSRTFLLQAGGSRPAD